MTPHRGCASTYAALVCRRYRPGHSPQEGDQCPGKRHHDLLRRFAACTQWPVPLTQAHLCLPADVLERLRYLLQLPLEVVADVRRIPVGQGAFDEGPAGMAVPRLGDGPLPTTLAAGVFRGGQAQVAHELSGVIEARQVAQFSHKSHGNRDLDTL